MKLFIATIASLAVSLSVVVGVVAGSSSVHSSQPVFSQDSEAGVSIVGFDLEDTFKWIQQHHHEALQHRAHRGLTHTIPPVATPVGCDYSTNHAGPQQVMVDEIFCEDKCGSGRDFTFTVTTTCDSNIANCNTVADCRVAGCTDSCGDGVGECECTIDSFEDVCDPCPPRCSRLFCWKD